MDIRIWQLDIKVELLKDIYMQELMTRVAYFVDHAMVASPGWADYHRSNNAKLYCFNSLYPIEKSGVYRAGNQYTIQLRTVSETLKNYLLVSMGDNESREMKTVSVACKEIRYRHLNKIVSVTPLILKTSGGYWKDYLLEREFLEELKINIIKKYRMFTNEDMGDGVKIFKNLTLKNRGPVAQQYKGIRILGDKVILEIENTPEAQKLAFFSLGTGCGCMTARGFSFMNPRWG